jgi:hypothetical protein
VTFVTLCNWQRLIHQTSAEAIVSTARFNHHCIGISIFNSISSAATESITLLMNVNVSRPHFEASGPRTVTPSGKANIIYSQNPELSCSSVKLAKWNKFGRSFSKLSLSSCTTNSVKMSPLVRQIFLNLMPTYNYMFKRAINRLIHLAYKKDMCRTEGVQTVQCKQSIISQSVCTEKGS